MTDEMDKILEENGILRQKLDETEDALEDFKAQVHREN